MKISYLVTCKNEVSTLYNLLTKICHSLNFHDESTPSFDDEIIILDDYSDDRRTQEIIKMGQSPLSKVIKTVQHHLNNDYGSHKNFGIEQCTGDWIFQIDGDELPPESLLGENLHALIDSNPKIEAYAVPRINDFRGVRLEHAAQWGWKLSESPTYKRPIVNWPDYQWRIFKKDYPKISFTKRLHERIEGFNAYSVLPATEEYALYHDKTIEKQIETNLKYNQVFTQEENKGHGVFK